MIIAICDEKAENRRKLCELLNNYQNARMQVFQIEEFHSGLELCKDKERLARYRIIFLNMDVETMEGMRAVMLLKELRPDLPIVMLTSFLDYTVNAYRIKSAHFLLMDQLEDTIEECMEDILREGKKKNQAVQFQFVEGETVLKVKDIIYIETNKHRNLFYTSNSTYSIYRKLSEIEVELAGLDFIRIHQSFLVNMRYIERISSYVCYLTTGEQLSVPKSRYQNVKRIYQEYLGGK